MLSCCHFVMLSWWHVNMMSCCHVFMLSLSNWQFHRIDRLFGLFLTDIPVKVEILSHLKMSIYTLQHLPFGWNILVSVKLTFTNVSLFLPIILALVSGHWSVSGMMETLLITAPGLNPESVPYYCIYLVSGFVRSSRSGNSANLFVSLFG